MCRWKGYYSSVVGSNYEVGKHKLFKIGTRLQMRRKEVTDKSGFSDF